MAGLHQLGLIDRGFHGWGFRILSRHPRDLRSAPLAWRLSRCGSAVRSTH